VPGTSVSARLSSGFFVDTALAGLAKIGALALTAVVARVLTPSAFGAVTIALSISSVCEAFTQLGLRTALQRRPDLTPRMVDVAWTISNLRAVALCGAISLSAPWLASLWEGGAEVTLYLRVLSLGFVGDALMNAHVVWRQRELKFGLALVLDNLKALVGVVISIGILWLTDHPVALVAGPAIGSYVGAAVSWLAVKPRPRPAWDAAYSRELFGFGRWLTGHSIFVYLFFTLDNMYVARTLGVAALGAYGLGWRLVNTAMTLLTRAIPRMLVPTYSFISSDQARLRMLVSRALSFSHFVGIGLASLLVLFADDLILLISGGGQAWKDATYVVIGLTPFTASRMQNQVVGPLFFASGKPKVIAMVSGLQLVLMLPALWVGEKLAGLLGVAVAMSLLSVMGGVLVGNLARLHFGISALDQLRSLPRALAAAALAGGALYPWLSGHDAGGLRFMMGTLAMGTLYVMAWELSLRLFPPPRGQSLSVIGTVLPLIKKKWQRNSESTAV
jgi:O-antigen/teichoic acid export membrane protein